MAETVTNVTTGKPKRAAPLIMRRLPTLPTDTAERWIQNLKLGYISDDGLTNTNAPDTDTVSAWGGDTVLI